MKSNVRQWIREYDRGVFAYPSVDTQIYAGWYDWFCKDCCLLNKTKKLGKIIKQISSEYILDNCRVSFKNNRPIIAPLYDTIRFISNETDLVEYMIIVGDEREDNTYCLYGKDSNDGFSKPMFCTNYKRDLIKYINETI